MVAIESYHTSLSVDETSTEGKLRAPTGSMQVINGSILILRIVKIDFSIDFCHESTSRVVSITFASG
jgi:hypothetical protein